MRNISSLLVTLRSLRLLPCFFFFIAGSVFSQPVIKGKITGRDGMALTGVTVAVKGTNNISITDSAGHFIIRANPGNIVVFSSIGYRDYQIILSNETELNISLTGIILNLNEVIAVGYGTSRKKDVTGAIARVTPDQFNTGVITSPLQQIEGKVAGLVIIQPGGDPNGDFIVRLRGATSLEGQPPLLVIDGVAIDDFNKAVSTLNPADIESYDILKDASAAAIYGSRGANGVILVTTKKGRAGRTSVDYNAFVSLDKISNELKVLSADQWRSATSAIGGSSLDKGGNTDWQKAISQTAISHSHTIGLGGGSDQFNFHGSIGYIRQEGVIINTGKEVITTRLTVNQKSLKNKLEIRYGLNTSATKRDFLPDQTATNYLVKDAGSFFEGVLSYLPVLPVYNPDGSYFQGADKRIQTPVFALKEVYSKKRENYFQSSVKADYEVIKGLKAGVLGAMTKGNDIYDFFYPGSLLNVKSIAFKSNDNKQIFSGDIHGNFQKTFDKHRIDITGAYEYNDFINDGFGLTASGFLVPSLLNNSLQTASQVLTSDIFSYKNEIRLISFLGRAVYNFDDRYLFTANFRRDGSSKFGPNHRWGNFPSVALAWRASNEKFLKEVKWLENLKLRISYGLTGNQENLLPNSYQLLYGPAGPYLYNGQFLQSYAITQENNPDLKWEVRKSFNIGVDFSILNDRLNGTIDFFNDKTSDMLFTYDLPQPPFLTSRVTANAANAVNKGVEITLGMTIVKNKKITWKVLGNIATLKNSITNLSGQFKGVDLSITNRHYGYAEGRGLSFAYISQLSVGQPAGVFWIPQHAGLDTGGHELYNNYDVNGKFVGTSTSYSDQDRVYIDPTPRYTWGFTNNFSFENFDLGFFLRGVQGQKIFANSLLDIEAKVYLPNSNVTAKALTNGFADQPQPSTYWLRDGSFARLENIMLGYHFNNLKGINNFRIYLAANNLFVITNYDGIDPEIRTEGAQRYIDQNYYPKARSFTFGVNIGF